MTVSFINGESVVMSDSNSSTIKGSDALINDAAKLADPLLGVVKWFNDAKGFGFIEHTSGRDVFVHYSVIDTEGFKTLKDGENVEYEMKEGPKGLQAVKVLRTAKPEEIAEASIDASQAEIPSVDPAIAAESNSSADTVENLAKQ